MQKGNPYLGKDNQSVKLKNPILTKCNAFIYYIFTSPVPQPGQAGTKKVIIHRRVRGVRREVFYFLL
jgi:hypothetical protein